MKPERRGQIERLCEAALERTEEERAEFLAEACGEDHALKREVESLLEQAEGFLPKPAIDVIARGLARELEHWQGSSGDDHRSIVSIGQMGSELTPKRWAQLKRLFEKAGALKPEDRDSFVESVRRDDPSLKRQLLALLEEQDQPASRFEEPFVSPEMLAPFPEVSEGDLLAGRFRIVSPLGKGGQAAVFRAFDSELDEHVALKVVRGPGLPKPEALARLKREIQLARRVTHPNVCRLYDLDRHVFPDGRGIVFLTMELIEGETLADRLRKRGKMTADEARPILRQVCQALEAAHQEGVIHRDLKPANVLLQESPDGSFRAVVTDFGIANQILEKDGNTKLTETGMILGTPDYISPEQLRGEGASVTADIYSLGVMAYEMVTGRPPFGEGTLIDLALKKMEGPPPSARSLVPDLPPAWDDALATCLEIEPAKRFQSPSELLDHLEDPKALIAPRRKRRRPLTAGRLAFLAVLVLGVPAMLALALLLNPSWLESVFPTADPIEPLQVAVLAPSVNEGIDQSTSQYVAFLVREATLNALAPLETIETIVPSDLGSTRASAVEIQKELASDEVLQTVINCAASECSVSFRRLRDGKTVQSSLAFSLSARRRDALDSSDAVAAYALRLYSAEAGAKGVSFVVKHRDYLLYLDLKGRTARGELLGSEELVQLEALAGTSPRFLPAYILVADVARTLDIPQRALRSLRQAEALFPEDPRPVYVRFNLAIAQDDIEDARTALARLESLSPGNPLVWSAQQILLEKEGKLEEAVLVSQRMVERRPTWQNLLRLGNLEKRLGRIESARNHLQTLLARYPDNAYCLLSLANLETDYGDLEKAEEHYSRLIEQQPIRENLVSLCWAQYLGGRYRDAINSCQRALDIYKESRLALFNLAAATQASGQGREALKLYGQLLDLLGGENPDTPLNPTDSLLKAKCLVSLGRPREAIALVENALTATSAPWSLYQAAAVYSLASAQLTDQQDLMRAKVIVQMEKALKSGLHSRYFRIPDFEPLLADPAFQGLLGSYTETR